MLRFAVIFTLAKIAFTADTSVQAINRPVTFRMEACNGEVGGFTCMTKPENCNSVETCELIAAWAPNSDGVEFTVIGKTSGPGTYVTIGFGESTKMDKIKATICAYDGQRLSIYNAYNEEYSSYALEGTLASSGISAANGQYANGRLACRFTRAISVSDSDKVARLDGAVHVSLGSGPMDGPMRHGYHIGTPIVSGEQRVNQASTGRVTAADENAKTRPLWKAHGVLMIIAWVLIVLSASLQPRYYRQMWPNNRPCGNQMWFAIHQPLMIIATILFTAGFILAMVAADGKYREPPALPQKAHPILGLIALILGWANPIIALFRCKPGAHYRPIFNWIHFIVGTVAIVFAVTNCFIGLSFSSIRAPAWTAWVLVAAVVFHLVVEILLELAGCFYYAKNKEKIEQYELRQQALSSANDPEPAIAKPKPAGRTFKNVMLALHSVVMTALVLAIVIGVCLN